MTACRYAPLATALALFFVWSAATWLLEGRIETLLRPHAASERVVYALVANVLIGVGASLLLLRLWLRRGADMTYAGFGSVRRAAISVVLGLALGFGLYLLQGAPTLRPVVLGNAYAQVLVVSAAEVLVCWAVLGWAAQLALRPLGRALALCGAAAVASVLFGLYHVAHSPPFNTPEMVGLLSVVGLVTSLFYFSSRDVAGTVVFHNFLGTFGVLRALEQKGELTAFQIWQPALLGMAFLSALALLAGYVLARRG